MRLILLLACLLVVSCRHVETTVTKFHSLPENGAGETFLILPNPNKGPLEFASNAARITDGLTKYGWVPSNTPDYKIFVDYDISDGKTTTGSMPIMGQTGGGTTFHSGTFNTYGSGGSSFGTVSGTSYTPPSFGIVGAIPVSETSYTRTLIVTAINKQNRSVLEATCRSTGTSADINVVMPAMVDSLFKEFPGKSGKSKKFTIPLR